MDVRPMQEIEVVVGIDVGAGLQADDGAKAFGMFERQMQRDAAADRTADQDRPIEFEGSRHLQNHGRVLRRGELVLLVVPAGRRRGLAVPRQVERDHTVAARDL
jgi:hypothetical protein